MKEKEIIDDCDNHKRCHYTYRLMRLLSETNLGKIQLWQVLRHVIVYIAQLFKEALKQLENLDYCHWLEKA